jgi:hypothetical protein
MSLVLPHASKEPPPSPFERFGLRDLPFPTDPVVNPYSADPRRNGMIYATRPAQAEIKKFEDLLVRPTDFLNRARLAYLWSKGDQQSGRGMGKTALLRYFRQRINVDWGQTEFKGQFSAVVVYVSFPGQVDRRYMEQLAQAGLVDVCGNGVLGAARAGLRLGKLPGAIGERVLEEKGAEGLLDDDALSAAGGNVDELNDAVTAALSEAGIGDEVARHLARGTFEDYLRGMRKDRNLIPLYVPRDTKQLDYSRYLLFNEIVLFLRTAGFAGGYLFIDDIENLVDQMSRKDRIEFAKEFALCTVRPGYANTNHGFFSCVLTTHQQASVGLSQAWGDAGLAAIARLDPGANSSVELPLPSKDSAREIIVAHLDHYRLDSSKNGTIEPFTEDGIEALLSINVHPRELLSRAAIVMQNAVLRDTIDRIDADLVRAVALQPAVTSGMIAGVTEGLDAAL